MHPMEDRGSHQAKGYPAAITRQTRGGLTMVSYQSFAHREDALNKLKTLKAEEDSAAWLYVN